jgi:hypothetical protein
MSNYLNSVLTNPPPKRGKPREICTMSTDADSYMCEVAQARRLLIVELAGRIVTGEWVRTEILQELTSAGCGPSWVFSDRDVVTPPQAVCGGHTPEENSHGTAVSHGIG